MFEIKTTGSPTVSNTSSQCGDTNRDDDCCPDYGLPTHNLECNGIQPINPSLEDETSESSMAHDLSISDTSTKFLLVDNEDNQPNLFKEQETNGNIY